MIKIKKGHQILFKEEAASELEKLHRDIDIETGEDENAEDWTQDKDRWNGFKGRYEDEFEDKIELLDSIITKKRNRIQVTWLTIFKEKD